MAKLNLTQAAKRVGVTRQTFHRHIKSKGISVSKNEKGHTLIDLSELARVYPDCNVLDVTGDGKKLRDHTLKNDSSDKALQVEVDGLKEQIDLLKDERDHLRRQLDDEKAERRNLSQRLLPAPEKPAEGDKYRLGWFDRLLGRKPLTDA